MLHIVGQTNEFRCQFTQNELDLGQISVFKKVESQFYIKNTCKLGSVLHVKSFPPGMEIVPMKTRLLMDETKQFRIFLNYTTENDVSSKVFL